MKRKLRINGHSHLLPYPEEIPQFMKDREIFGLMMNENTCFKKDGVDLLLILVFLDEKLEWMEKNRIDHAVVLNLSQLYGNGLRLEMMKKALRFQNDFNAKIQQDHYKIYLWICNPPGFIQGALWKLKDVLRIESKCFMSSTHFMDSIGQWRSVFDRENDAIFELANHYKLAIEIHPYDGEDD